MKQYSSIIRIKWFLRNINNNWLTFCALISFTFCLSMMFALFLGTMIMFLEDFYAYAAFHLLIALIFYILAIKLLKTALKNFHWVTSNKYINRAPITISKFNDLTFYIDNNNDNEE